MSRLIARSSVLGGVALVLSCGWVLLTSWNPVVHGHPSYLFFYVGLMAVGAGVLAVRLTRPDSQLRWWSVAGSAGLILLSLVALWLSPFEAESHAIASMKDSERLHIVESWTSISLEPGTTEPELTLVFYPGARVDARAYSELLIPVAEAGFRVVIVKVPLGIAFLSMGSMEPLIESHPDMRSWVVGGHSLGGVVASSQAVDLSTTGLLLWASYPATDMSAANSLNVASVYGSNDGLTLPKRVEASAEDLPGSTRFYEIEGAVHSYFGDYGTQPGDGEPSSDRRTAQQQIVGATVAFLQGLTTR